MDEDPENWWIERASLDCAHLHSQRTMRPFLLGYTVGAAAALLGGPLDRSNLIFNGKDEKATTSSNTSFKFASPETERSCYPAAWRR